MTTAFISAIVDRFIQQHPPNFNAAMKSELSFKLQQRYSQLDLGPPSEILAALDLTRGPRRQASECPRPLHPADGV